MQNENLESKNQIKRNPTRFNKNINRGENEKSADEKNSTTGNFKVNPSEYSGDKDYLGGRGEFNPGTSEGAEFHGGPEAGDYDDESGTVTEKQQGGKGAGTTKGVQKEQQQAQQQSGSSLGREKNETNKAGAGVDYGGENENEEEEKQLKGGSNKGAQVAGASGKDDEGYTNKSGGQGTSGSRMDQSPNQLS